MFPSWLGKQLASSFCLFNCGLCSDEVIESCRVLSFRTTFFEYLSNTVLFNFHFTTPAISMGQRLSWISYNYNSAATATKNDLNSTPELSIQVIRVFGFVLCISYYTDYINVFVILLRNKTFEYQPIYIYIKFVCVFAHTCIHHK